MDNISEKNALSQLLKKGCIAENPLMGVDIETNDDRAPPDFRAGCAITLDLRLRPRNGDLVAVACPEGLLIRQYHYLPHEDCLLLLSESGETKEIGPDDDFVAAVIVEVRRRLKIAC